MQILSMIEEAAGTRLYETKRQCAQRTIEKKDAKLREIDTVGCHYRLGNVGHAVRRVEFLCTSLRVDFLVPCATTRAPRFYQ